MQMKIKTLLIENFKGIRRFELSPESNVTIIKAKNGAGKTSVYDGFLWLLFGVNSAGDAKFEVRPTNSPMEIEPTVTAILTVDGKEIELKKRLASKFSKDTGEFKESKTECYINGVKKGPKEYEQFITTEICRIEKFKLLTNPRYFTEDYSWQERREVLFEVAGTMSEADIIASRPEFEELTDKLNKYGNISEFKKYLKGEGKALSEQANALPVRIDETFRSIDSTLNADRESELLADYRKQLEIEKEKLFALQNGNEIAPLTKGISEIDVKIANLKGENDRYRSENYLKMAKALNEKEADLNETKAESSERIRTLQSTVQTLEKAFKQDETLLKNALTTYREISDKSFQDICPTCNRPFPEEQIAEEREKFINGKAEQLAEIKATGEMIRETMNANSAEREQLIEKTAVLIKSMEKINEEIAETREQLDCIVVEDMDGYSAKLSELEKQKNELECEIANKRAAESENVNRIKSGITLMEIDISESEKRLAKVAVNAEAERRLAELKDLQKTVAAKRADVTRLADIVSDFVRTKVSLIESNINAKFKLARFKLFSQNITNDDINECCDVIAYNSPSYKNLSNGQKSMVGIDVIQTLSQHYGITVPLFFDNLDALDSENQREVFAFAGEDIQKIALLVSDDETLKISIGGN